MTAPQRLTKAQAKMIEDARSGPVQLQSGQGHAANRRTAESLEALGLGRLTQLAHHDDGPLAFVSDAETIDRYFAALKDWQKRPRGSGKGGMHSGFDRAVTLRLDGKELARWKKLAARAKQSFKAWARDAFLAHEVRKPS